MARGMTTKLLGSGRDSTILGAAMSNARTRKLAPLPCSRLTCDVFTRLLEVEADTTHLHFGLRLARSAGDFIIRDERYPDIVRIPIALLLQQTDDVTHPVGIVQPAAGVLLGRAARFLESKQGHIPGQQFRMLRWAFFRGKIQVN